MEEKKFNPYSEKINIGQAINLIGINKEIRLVFNKKGQFMVSSMKDDYYPSDQGPIDKWDYETKLTLKRKNIGDFDWAKYAAEDMIYEIEKQMNRPLMKVNK